MRIRASADPAAGAEQRVLAGVEQRIALEASASGDGVAGAAAGGGISGVSGAMARVVRGSRAAGIAMRMGRWGVFGLVAGAIGYQLGVHHERSVSAAAASPVAVAVGSGSISTLAPRAPAMSVQAGDIAPTLAERDELAEAASIPTPQPMVMGTQASAVAHATSGGAGPRTHLHMPGRATGPRGDQARAPAPRPAQARPALPLSLSEILERLQRAQRALQDGDPHAALSELSELDQLEPTGTLADERRVLRALAFCDIGRIGDARQVLDQLGASADDSIYRGRLEQGCAAALAR
jgi:hypothetical protein